MSTSTTLLEEYDHEMANTRKVLARVPDDKLDWQAHPKSNSIGWVASHLAEIPSWIPGTMQGTSWDFSPPGEEPYRTPILTSRQAILDSFDANVAAGRQAIAAAQDADYLVIWSLLMNGQTLFSLPRYRMLRDFVLNHSIHHRAHLLVYLRLNDVPVPGMYGPSADESGG